MKQQQQQRILLSNCVYKILIGCIILQIVSAGFSSTNNNPLLSQQRRQRDERRSVSSPTKFLYKQRQATKKSSLILSSSSSEGNTNNDNSDRVSGLLVAASVPIAWGTYSPVVKYLYQVEPVIPGIVFSAAYYIVASIVLNTIIQLQSNNNKEEVISDETDNSFPVRGGIELGLYLFIANALQVTGLETVQADRAGFLVQLTTIIVPFLQAILSDKSLKSISIRTWSACVLAFLGVLVMGFDGKEVAVNNLLQQALTLSRGDLLIVAAAVLYSFHVVRLSRYARTTTPLKLAASKSNTEAVLSIAVVSYLLFVGQQQDVTTFVTDLSAGLQSGTITLTTLTPAILAVLWTGIVTCAYTIFAQSYGQARISPTEANLLYTIQPLYTAFFGFLLLNEKLGRAGIVGALFIASAVYIVCKEEESINNTDDNNDDDDDNNNDSGIIDIESNNIKFLKKKTRTLETI
mmetsp:Transcript_43554/g.49409  ORF Transcript_43554/g.49409 Transcript_43554/m.49409 type:complete len:462 (+) Transcript_43554:62-1447(+)